MKSIFSTFRKRVNGSSSIPNRHPVTELLYRIQERRVNTSNAADSFVATADALWLSRADFEAALRSAVALRHGAEDWKRESGDVGEDLSFPAKPTIEFTPGTVNSMKTHLSAHAELTARALKLIESLADLDAESAIEAAELAGHLLLREACLRACAPPPQSSPSSR